MLQLLNVNRPKLTAGCSRTVSASLFGNIFLYGILKKYLIHGEHKYRHKNSYAIAKIDDSF